MDNIRQHKVDTDVIEFVTSERLDKEKIMEHEGFKVTMHYDHLLKYSISDFG